MEILKPHLNSALAGINVFCGKSISLLFNNFSLYSVVLHLLRYLLTTVSRLMKCVEPFDEPFDDILLM